jgi:hypothetical protein
MSVTKWPGSISLNAAQIWQRGRVDTEAKLIGQFEPYQLYLLAEKYATCSYGNAQFYQEVQWYSLRTERSCPPPSDLCWAVLDSSLVGVRSVVGCGLVDIVGEASA